MADVAVNESSTDPIEHYDCGFRAMMMGDYSTAVAAFGKCSELKATTVGDKDDSLGETYYYYGKCLLEASREEHNELGDAIPNEEDEDEEEGEVGEEDGENADEDNAANEEKDAEAAANGKEEHNGTNGTANDEDGEKQEADSTGDGAGGSGAEEQPTADEDATDLQVAWEVLELAKIIFENRGDVAKEKLADTLILLGEVSLESENFESGIQDIQHGLEIHKSVYGDDNRKLAESYYKLGMAMNTCSRYDEAAENFKNSLNVLKNVVSRLEASANKDTDETKIEIEEVKGLIPEIEEKINDTKTYRQEAVAALMSTLAPPKVGTDAGSSSSGSSGAKPTTDISHLVKRKRKVENEEAESSTTDCLAKKPSP